MNHVGQSDEEGASEHQIGHDPQDGERNGQEKEKGGKGDPFDAAEIGGQFRLRGGVDALEEPFTKDAMINHRLVDQPSESRGSIDLSLPLGCTGRTKEDQVLETKEGFGFSITFLLLTESLQGEAAIVPYDGRRAEGNHLALLLKAPAKVHIVTSFSVFRIEASDLFKGPAVKGHVAPGDMFRNDICEKNMTRASRCGGNACLMPILSGRGDIRSPDAGIVPREEGSYKIVEPVRICHAVAVGVGNNLASGRRRADIPRKTEAVIRLVNGIYPGVMRENLLCLVRRTVIDNDNFVIGIIDFFEGAKTCFQGLATIVATDNHRDLGNAG